MSLSDVDRQLLDRCLANEPKSWEAFIDRFLGLVVHVINHTAGSRGVYISIEQRDDLVSEVFLTLVQNDYRVLRSFRRRSSLATYLTVIARRVVGRKLIRHVESPLPAETEIAAPTSSELKMQMDDREQVEELMTRLDPKERVAVRMHHLEGKSYKEISTHMGLPVNSIGPMLSRARDKMREFEAAE